MNEKTNKKTIFESLEVDETPESAETTENAENTGKIQDHLDELYLLEKKAGERAEVLQENCIELSKFAKKFVEKAHQLNSKTVESTGQATIAANTINTNLKSAHRLYLHSIKMLVISVFITTTLIISWIVINFHYESKVSEEKSTYQYFLSQIDKTLVILKKNGKNYVLIKPGSEQNLVRDNGKSDTFAKIKYF
jgi:hypothetical protein